MAESKGLLNYSTNVSVERTLAEMTAMLGRAGAARIATDYADGEPVALAFTLTTPVGPRLYTLPCEVAAVQRVLRDQDARGLLKGNSIPKGGRAGEAQAARVAWRVLKDWLEAQLALVRTQMASLDQVMLPYVHVDQQTTLYQAWRDHDTRALPPA